MCSRLHVKICRCGCGIPPELLEDSDGFPVPYVALNVQNTGILDDALARPLKEGSDFMGMFNNGINCGRWIEITFMENCVGKGNSLVGEPPMVCGANAYNGDPLASFQPDQYTGTKVYAVVADSAHLSLCIVVIWCCQRPIFLCRSLHINLVTPVTHCVRRATQEDCGHALHVE
jgi:hypothetical protein